MAWLGKIKNAVLGLADELMPSESDRAWRDAVADGFHFDRGTEYCGRCGISCAAEATNANGCPTCRGKSLPWDRVIRLTRYTQPVSDWLVDMKFHGSWRWSEVLGERLGAAVVESNFFNHDGVTLGAVCPVPMHWRRRVGRGFDQATILAEQVSRATCRPVAHLLLRKRFTTPQTHVKFAERRRNIANAIVARKVDLSGCEILIVDDIKTSGATAMASARALRALGAAKVGLAVVAVAESGRLVTTKAAPRVV